MFPTGYIYFVDVSTGCAVLFSDSCGEKGRSSLSMIMYFSPMFFEWTGKLNMQVYDNNAIKQETVKNGMGGLLGTQGQFYLKNLNQSLKFEVDATHEFVDTEVKDVKMLTQTDRQTDNTDIQTDRQTDNTDRQTNREMDSLHINLNSLTYHFMGVYVVRVGMRCRMCGEVARQHGGRVRRSRTTIRP